MKIFAASTGGVCWESLCHCACSAHVNVFKSLWSVQSNFMTSCVRWNCFKSQIHLVLNLKSDFFCRNQTVFTKKKKERDVACWPAAAWGFSFYYGMLSVCIKGKLHPNLCGFTLRQVLGQPHHVPLFTPSVTSVSYHYRNVQLSPRVNVLNAADHGYLNWVDPHRERVQGQILKCRPLCIQEKSNISDKLL